MVIGIVKYKGNEGQSGPDSGEKAKREAEETNHCVIFTVSLARWPQILKLKQDETVIIEGWCEWKDYLTFLSKKKSVVSGPNEPFIWNIFEEYTREDIIEARLTCVYIVLEHPRVAD